jgi:hypothetical protein
MAAAHVASTSTRRSSPVKCRAVSSAPVCTGDSWSVKMSEIAAAISSAVTPVADSAGHSRLSSGVMETTPGCRWMGCAACIAAIRGSKFEVGDVELLIE